MLIVTLVISISALVLMNLAVRYERAWLGIVVCGGLVLLSIPLMVIAFLFLPTYPVTTGAIILQGLFTLPVFAVLLTLKYGKVAFIPLSVLAMLLAYGVVIHSASNRQEQRRREYPFESVEGRLPNVPKSAPIDKTVLNRSLEVLESELNQSGSRSRMFERIHSTSLSQFLEAPGFGTARMEGHEMAVVLSERRNEPIPQPKQPLPSDFPSGEILSSGALDDNLNGLHRNSVLDFVNPQGFGYVKSRSQVAGFRPHRFSEVPTKANWAVNSVELVGILIHEKPGVYLSDHLPRMDELKAAKTRPLDTFEAEGLAALEKGEDLFVRGTNGTARMMGAVRNATQCVKCHGGNRGDLLGAFAYRLRKN